MNIFYFMKKSFKYQFNTFIAITSIPGYKFANCYANRLQQLFWHGVLNFCLMVTIVICLRFWNQYQNQSTLPVYEILEQGSKLPYPSVYLCLGFPLNPKSLSKYRKEFLKSNLSMSIKEIDENLQKMLRFQRASHNVSYQFEKLFRDNVNIDRLQGVFVKLFYNINELLKDCYVQGQPVECDDIFMAMELAPGFCFVFNSIYTNKGFHENPRKVAYKEFSEFNEDWTLRFKIFYGKDTTLSVYLKEPHSLLSLTDYPNYVWRPRKQISKYSYTIVNQYSERTIRNLKLSQRKCIFSDETFPNKNLKAEFGTNFYNQDVCLNYCHVLQFIKACQCLPTFGEQIFLKLANQTRICNFNDLLCYESNYLAIRRHDCKECYSNCNRTVYVSRPEIQEPRKIKYFVEKQAFNSSSKMDYFEFTIDLEYWPIIQSRVIIIFSKTEFISIYMVLNYSSRRINFAIATISSLFLGTSIITCLESFYCLFIRYPASYFVNRDYIERKIKKQEEIELMKPIPCINMSLKPGLKK